MRQRFALLLCSTLVASPSLVAQGPGQGGRGVTIQAGEQCPPGMTEVRPRNCQAPTLPVPSILDYRPRSTLIAPSHAVPRAKFPVVDVHTHGTSSYVSNPEKIKEMDALNLRVLVDLSGGSNPDEIKRKVDAINASPYKDRFRVFANVAWEGAGGAGWQDKAVADLRQAVKNGAIGLKVFKELGM